MKPPTSIVPLIPKHHPTANIRRTSGPRRPARCGLSMEFRNGAKPSSITNKPVNSSLLRTRANLSDSSGSFGIPQAYLRYLAGASDRNSEPYLSGFFFTAQRFFCAKRIFRLVAALNGFRFFGVSLPPITEPPARNKENFFGGRPLRFPVLPDSASMALLSRSRS